MFSFFVGWRYTGGRRRNQLVSFISTISTTGLVVSVCLLIVVLSVLNGFDKEMRERVLSMVEQVSLRNIDEVDNWQQWRQQLMQHPEVLAATPFVEIAGAAIFHKQVSAITLLGIDPDLEPTVSGINQYMEQNALELLRSDSNNIIIGSELAKKLGIESGERLRMIVPPRGSSYQWSESKPVALTVVGIINTGTDLDQQLAITSLASAQKLASLDDRVTGVKLKLKDLFAAQEVAYSIYADLPGRYYLRIWTQTHGNKYQNIQVSKKIVSLLLFLIIAIAGFNLVSTLVMVVVDKQGDIAILRTLGASTQKIMAIFMVQGSAIGFIGTGTGVALGILLSYWVTDIVAALENLIGIQFVKSDVYPTNFLPSDIRVEDVVLVAVVSLALSFVATLYPAWRASRVKPAEALRFDL